LSYAVDPPLEAQRGLEISYRTIAPNNKYNLSAGADKSTNVPKTDNVIANILY